MALHWVLTLGLLAGVAWLLLRNEAGFEDVGAALAQVGSVEVVVLLVLTALIQVTFGWEYAAGLRGLGLTRGLVLFEGQTAVSNLIPGPSGTATRLMMLRSWGFSLDDFSRLWLVTSGVTDLLVLAMPIVAVAGAAAVGDAESGTAWGIAAAGVVVGAVLALLAVLALRSERLATRLGAVSGRVITWVRGIARRAPTDEDFAAAAVNVRRDLIVGWRECGVPVTIAASSNYVLQGMLLLVSARAVGLDESLAGTGGVLAVYAIYRLLTIVQITPGSVGVAEAVLTAGLLSVTGGEASAQIAAAILLFRGLTYVAPILFGGLSLLAWRFVVRWRAEAPREDAGAAAVTSAVLDREGPGN
jgi:uncharacterized membrane protein YbhN (UPF0104 family)